MHNKLWSIHIFFLKIIINDYKYNFCLLGETGLPGEPGRQGLQGFPGPKGKLISEIWYLIKIWIQIFLYLSIIIYFVFYFLPKIKLIEF